MTTIDRFQKRPVDEYEDALLARIRNGDRRACESMLAKYDGWATWYARRIILCNPDFEHSFDDVRQEVVMSMLKAMSSFDPTRGGSLVSWMALVVGRDSNHFLYDNIGTVVTIGGWVSHGIMGRASSRIDGITAVHALVNACNDCVPLDEVFEVIESMFVDENDPGDHIDQSTQCMIVAKAISHAKTKIGPRKSAIIRDIFGDSSVTYTSVAANHNISRERVRQIWESFCTNVRAEVVRLGYVTTDTTTDLHPCLCVKCRRCGSVAGIDCVSVHEMDMSRDLATPLRIPHIERRMDARAHMQSNGLRSTERTPMFVRPPRQSN